MKKKEDISIKPNTYLNDTVKGVQDDFGIHTQIANALTKKISSADVKNNSFTIGLLGEWGTGKSVIVEKMREKLEKDDTISFAIIDVWKYNGLPLLRHILNEIVEQLPERMRAKDKREIKNSTDSAILIGKEYKDIQSGFKTFLDKIVLIIAIITTLLAITSSFISDNFTSVVWKEIVDYVKTAFTSISVPCWLIKLFSSKIFNFINEIFRKINEDIIVVEKKIVPTISPEQFESILNDILCRLKKINIDKHIIVFDNIDRCRPEFAYEVLSTIKTYLDKPNCIYLIPCDDIALKHYLDSQYKGNKAEKSNVRNFSADFLDKLFTTFFRIPPINEVSRDEFIMKCLDSTILNDLSDKERIMQVLYYAYKGETPRQIKKFINDFISYYEIATEIDPEKTFLLDDISTFAVMVTIKQIAPEFEKQLILNPEIILSVTSNINGSDKVLPMFEKLNFSFPEQKAVLSYVYFSKVENDQEIRRKLRDAQPIEISTSNIKIIRDTINIDKKNETFLVNDFISVCLSITKFGIGQFLENAGSDYKSIGYQINEILEFETIDEDDIKYSTMAYKCVEFLDKDSENICEVLKILFKFPTFVSNKNNFFNSIFKMKNSHIVYEVIAKNKEFDFSESIEKYLSNIQISDKNEIDANAIDLLELLSTNGRYEYFGTKISKKISLMATYDNTKMRNIEKTVFQHAEVEDVVSYKIELLCNKIKEIIGAKGPSISTDIDNLFANIDLLQSYNDLRMATLEEAGKQDKSSAIKTIFKQYLFKLSNLPNKVNNMFILGSKLFDISFISECYINESIIYANREGIVNEISKDNRLLQKYSQSETLWKKIITENNLLQIVLKNTTKEWKIQNIKSFIFEPVRSEVFKEYLKCEEWDDKENELIKKHATQKAILSLIKYKEDNNIYVNKHEIIDIFDTLLSTYSGLREDLLLGAEAFTQIDEVDISLASELLNVFQNYKVIYNERLEAVLKAVPEHIKNKTLDDATALNLRDKIKGFYFDKNKKNLIMTIAKEAIDATKEEHIIEFGITCLEKLRENGVDTISQYAGKFELIKSSGILLDRIDELQGNKKLVEV